MILLLLALAMPSMAQSLSDRARLDALEIAVKELQSGRPTLTSFTTNRGSITFSVTDSGVVWADGTISTSAGAGGSAANFVKKPGDMMTGDLSLVNGSNIIVAGTATIQSTDFSVGKTTFVITSGTVLIGTRSVQVNVDGDPLLDIFMSSIPVPHPVHLRFRQAGFDNGVSSTNDISDSLGGIASNAVAGQEGGLRYYGISASSYTAQALRFIAITSGVETCTDTETCGGDFLFNGYQYAPSHALNLTTAPAGANILLVANFNTPLFIIKGNGDTYQPGDSNAHTVNASTAIISTMLRLGGSGPVRTLSVSGGAYIDSKNAVEITLNSNTSPPYGHIGNPSDGLFTLGYGQTTSQIGSTNLSWTTTGYVGINTITPFTNLDVNGNVQVGSTAKSTFSAAGALTMAANTAVTLSGASGNVISVASVTATAFFGDGSHLGGIPSSSALAGYLPLSGGSMTGQLTVGQSSSMTVQGAFQATGSTLTVTTAGIITGASQPRAIVTLSVAEAVANSTWQDVFWDTVESNPNGMFAIASSNTITIPTGGGGLYDVDCTVMFATNITNERGTRILVNGSVKHFQYHASATGSGTTSNAHRILNLVAGDAVKCQVVDESGLLSLNIGGDSLANSFSVTKLW